MALRRVVMLAMPCAEVVEIGGVLDIFYTVNERLAQAGTPDRGYAVEVVSPGPTVNAWPGLRLVAGRPHPPPRGPPGTPLSPGVGPPAHGPPDPRPITRPG